MGFLDKIKSYFKPVNEVRLRDAIREVPGAASKVAKKIGEFAYEIPKAAARVSIQAGLQTKLGKNFTKNGRTSLDPKEFGIEKIIGDKPIRSFSTQQQDYQASLEKKGFNKFESNYLATGGVVGLVALDSWIGSGAAGKKAFANIAQADKANSVFSTLKEFDISPQIKSQIAPVLAKTKSAKKIASTVKTAEMITQIERSAGIRLPNAARQKVSQQVLRTAKLPPAESNKILNTFQKNLIKDAPKKQTTIARAQTAMEVQEESVKKAFGIGEKKVDAALTSGIVSPEEIVKLRDVAEKITTGEAKFSDIKQASNIFEKAGVSVPTTFKAPVARKATKDLAQEAVAFSSKEDFIKAQPGFKDMSSKEIVQLQKVYDNAIKTVSANDTEVIQNAAQRYLPEKKGFFTRKPKSNLAKLEKGASKKEFAKLAGDYLAPIHTRIKNTSADMGTALRKFEFGSMTKSYEKTKRVLPILEASKKMSKEDNKIFDMARKNRDMPTVNALVNKYGIQDAYKEMRNVLEEIYKEARRTGIDIAKLDNYFPRMVKNSDALITHLTGKSSWSKMQKVIEEEANKAGQLYTDLTNDEIAQIATRIVEGTRGSSGKIGPAQRRTVELISKELDEFYQSSDVALAEYVTSMTNEIEARKFFGKELKVDADKINTDDSIGAYVMKALAKGDITFENEKILTDALKARFKKSTSNGFINTYKNLEYASTMGNYGAAATQLGDLSWSAYSSGHLRTIVAAAESLAGKSPLKREDFGVTKISEEFSDATKSAKMLNFVFKKVGLDKMDKMGKEALVNAYFRKMTSLSKKHPEKAREELSKHLYDGEIDQAIKEFANKKITDRTKFAAFSRLSDFQPITQSEMPQKYLEGSNRRILYMLKSFTLKQYDAFRREVFKEIKDGYETGDNQKIVKGVRNLVLLGSSFMAYNASADEIKDLMFGREVSMKDRVTDNMLRMFGASKYDIYKSKEDGVLNQVFKKVLPPASIAEGIFKDVSNRITEKAYKTGPMKGEKHKSELAKSVPIAGKLFYWWFGRGEQKQRYNDSKGKAKSSSTKKSTTGSKLKKSKSKTKTSKKGGSKIK